MYIYIIYLTQQPPLCLRSHDPQGAWSHQPPCQQAIRISVSNANSTVSDASTPFSYVSLHLSVYLAYTLRVCLCSQSWP